MKSCIKCKEFKELDSFHKHKRMSDGHVNICKDCQRLYEKQRRIDNPEYFSQYEKSRKGLPQRLELNKRIGIQYRQSNPNRYKATNIVNNAIRDGKINKIPCFCCGSSNVVAHHVSYDLPLDIVWLCQKHHRQLHTNLCKE